MGFGKVHSPELYMDADSVGRVNASRATMRIWRKHRPIERMSLAFSDTSKKHQRDLYGSAPETRRTKTELRRRKMAKASKRRNRRRK